MGALHTVNCLTNSNGSSYAAYKESIIVCYGKYVCEYDVIFTHHSSVVHQLKVSVIFAFFVWPRFQEVGRLAKVIIVEFSFEAALCGFREHALLLQNRQYTQRLQTTQEGGNS